METNSTVLSIKLKMPQPRKNYIIRKHLFEKLANLYHYKITIIKSGAGSGKTTLLTSYIKENNIPTVKWVSLDEHANNVFVFWKYVIECLNEYLGESAHEIQDLFDNNLILENMKQLLSILIDKIQLPHDLILILDDFHFIHEDFLVSTLNYFIENMAERLHIVLITRELPAIYLGTLALNDDVLIIDEEEIRLSPNECKEFIESTLQLNNLSNIEDIIQASDGWIGGLQLLATSLKEKNSGLQALGFSNRILDDYITKEIFDYLSLEEQTFLIQSSILRYFNKEICNTLIPNLDFNQMIESILKKNLFVINLDTNDNIFRYHAILSEYLTTLFEKQPNSFKYQLHETAALIYYKIGDTEESLYHLFQIGNYTKIMELILTMPQTSLAFSYISKVPMEEIINNPDFAYQYYFCHYATLDINSCFKIYNYISEHLNQEQSFAAFQNANLFFSDISEFTKVNVLTLDQIDKLPLNPVTTSVLLIKEAYFLFASSKHIEAIRYLEYAEKVYRETGSTYIGYFLLSIKTQIYEDMGELNKCFSMYRELYPMIKSLNNTSMAYYIGIAGVYTKQLALSLAGESLRKAKECMPENCSNIDNAYLYTLAEYSYLMEDYKTCEDIILKIFGDDIEGNIIYCARLLRYPIYRGKHNRLATIFSQNYAKLDKNKKGLDCDLLYATIQYENGEVETATRLIDSLISNARKNQNKLKIIECDLFKARMLTESNGDTRMILNLFVEAVSYAIDNQIALPFWFDKETTQTIYNQMYHELQLRLTKEELKFIQNIINLDTNTGLCLEKDTVGGLTEREKEVLTELANGCTNKQIAEKLCISLSTVKSHIINIYGKLEVNNRVAAINKLKFSNK